MRSTSPISGLSTHVPKTVPFERCHVDQTGRRITVTYITNSSREPLRVDLDEPSATEVRVTVRVACPIHLEEPHNQRFSATGRTDGTARGPQDR
jgi:hypothetical protein